MAEAQFPKRSSGDTTLPSGEKVWVRTLNDLHREEVISAANWAGREAASPLRKGGRHYASIMAQLRDLTADTLADAVTTHEMRMGGIVTEIREKHPTPPKPERDAEESDEQFMARADAWEVECKGVEVDITKAVEADWERRRADVLALPPGERLKRAHAAEVETAYAEGFTRAFKLEALRRAVRFPDDHNQMRYTCLQEIIDLDDADRDHLCEFYDELDSVGREVPT